MAIFTNNMNAGSSLEGGAGAGSQISTFIGPCKIKLETGDSRFAPFRNVSHALTGGESSFHSTVYFVNTTYMNELKWGTQEAILVEDLEEQVNVHVRAHGLFGVHIEQVDTSRAEIQARKFLQKVVGTRADYTRDELVAFMRAKILEYVPDLLANQIINEKIGVLKINAHLSEFSKVLYGKLTGHFDTFGLTLDNFSFNNINVPDEDLRLINDSKIKKNKDRLEAEGNAAKMDIESAARARMREREGYTYQQEQSYGVMRDAAKNEGTSSGLMGAGMGLGMGFGVGGAFNANMSAIAQNTIMQTDTQSSKKTCANCGTKSPNTAKFCLNCGEKFASEQSLKCPECGENVTNNAKFCPNCGHRFSLKCPNCGMDLAQGAKFCLECGTKI